MGKVRQTTHSVFLLESLKANPFLGGACCYIFKWLWFCTSLLQNKSNPARTTGSAENTGRKVREWFDLKPGKEIFQDVSGRNDKEKKISRTWNCFLQGSLYVLSVFFSQWLDKWTSTPQSAWRFNRSKYSGSSISFPDAAEQAQKKARMEESWGHESLISFSPHFNYFLPLNRKIATTE